MRLGDAALCIAAALLVGSEGHAGKYNEVLSIGDQAPAWRDLPDAVSGKKHSLDELKDVPVLVVVFTCNSCPVATDYEERILAIARRYGSSESKVQGPRSKVDARSEVPKLALVAINVNKVKDDLPPAMKDRAERKKYPFLYLYDETQKIARDFGANFTPEFFVLDPERKVIYMGAMDDNTNAADVKHKYLEPAVEAALAGRAPETTETLPVGCRIRYARERRVKND